MIAGPLLRAVEERAHTWVAKWAPRASDQQEDDDQRMLAKELEVVDPPPAVSALQLWEACRLVPAERAVGPCGWSFGEWRDIPAAGWEALAHIIAGCEARGTWPSAVAENTIVLLPKPRSTSDRAISLTSALYAIWAKPEGRRGCRSTSPSPASGTRRSAAPKGVP